MTISEWHVVQDYGVTGLLARTLHMHAQEKSWLHRSKLWPSGILSWGHAPRALTETPCMLALAST